jgi:Na+/citrate or Na+/malate symporter
LAVQHFSRIPLDVWLALAVAVGLVLVQLIEPAHVFAAAYVAICAYIVLSVFTDA